MVNVVPTPALIITFGTVTSPCSSAATVPDPPPDDDQRYLSPALGLNFWQRRGVTSAVISSLAKSLETVTDHLSCSSTMSFQSKPRLMPPSRSPSLGSPLPILLSIELLPKAG